MLEKNRIYSEDCKKTIERITDESIAVVLTSPPYYAYKDYGNDKDNLENFSSYEKYIIELDKIIKSLFRVICSDGRIILIVDDKHTNKKTEGVNINRGTHARLILAAEQAGFEYKDLIIWAKARQGNASGGSKYMLGSYPYPPNIPFVNWFEYILIFRKPGKSRVTFIKQEKKEESKLGFNEFKWASESIWYIGAEKNRDHPCPFPEKLAARLIRLFSFCGEIIYDPFIGSGTTAVVAERMGRNWIGSEINSEFSIIANRRIEAQRNQTRLAI